MNLVVRMVKRMIDVFFVFGRGSVCLAPDV